MTDPDDYDTSSQAPAVREVEKRRPARSISSAWVIPLVAIALGAWLVWQHFERLGPKITVTFETAEGLESGKTPVLCRSVQVGKVTDISLGPELKKVFVTIQMQEHARELLYRDSQFWVVRPRFGGSGVSGLGTLISGAYIELDPGTGEPLELEPEDFEDDASEDGTRVEKEERAEELMSDSFVGLEEPPVTSQSVPGLRLVIQAKDAQSVNPGSPITYSGFEVGKIEQGRFDPESRMMIYQAFIRAPYEELVTENVAFWDNSGVSVKTGARGFEFRSGSLESIIAGGVAFGLPKDKRRGKRVENGATFQLFENYDAVNEIEIQERLTYLLMFDASVRGLAPEAPVEFRGIQVGKVADISFDYRADPDDPRVPVLIKLDPSRFGSIRHETSGQAVEDIAAAVEDGLRATLRTGSLLTGALYVDLDYEEEPEIIRDEIIGGIPSIPTESGSLARIEDRVVEILDKVRALPVEETISTANRTLEEIQGTASAATRLARELEGSSVALERLLSSPDVTGLPVEVRKTLEEARRSLAGVGPDSAIFTDLALTLEDFQSTLQSIKLLSDTIDAKPNALIFGKEGPGKDPIPGSR